VSWWNGLEFLKKPKSKWPVLDCLQDEDKTQILAEVKKYYKTQICLLLHSGYEKGILSTNLDILDPAKFSSYNRLLRTTAYVWIYLKKLRERALLRKVGAKVTTLTTKFLLTEDYKQMYLTQPPLTVLVLGK
jgi:hypothetical protein